MNDHVMNTSIPVLDLFSGPGGLAEGFASLGGSYSNRYFRIALSIEVDRAAHKTLRMRNFLRKFQSGFPREYYEYLNHEILSEPDWGELHPNQWKQSCVETLRLELGTRNANRFLRSRIRNMSKEHKGRSVLLGGPPCQSFSFIGRARNAGNPSYDANKDERHSLYLEYTRALRQLRPAVAVLENVDGILSAKYHGRHIFPQVLDRLQRPGGNTHYSLYALGVDTLGKSWGNGLLPKDFIVRAEEFGVPQRRHRVFVVCIRRDVASTLTDEALPVLRPRKPRVNVEDVIGWMPVMRSRLSKGDSGLLWQRSVRAARELIERNRPNMIEESERKFNYALNRACLSTHGDPLPFADQSGGTLIRDSCPENLRNWLHDPKVTCLANNDTRGHMREDIARYLFAAAFAYAVGRSPIASDFPQVLAPKHKSWASGRFADRFKVQLPDHPSSTITSHISKDGHYFIHPDTRQCRSLTVREAARLQTFPDNYIFFGGRTQQYVQVGNAVPPFLALQIAAQISKVFDQWELSDSREPQKRGRAFELPSKNTALCK